MHKTLASLILLTLLLASCGDRSEAKPPPPPLPPTYEYEALIYDPAMYLIYPDMQAHRKLIEAYGWKLVIPSEKSLRKTLNELGLQGYELASRNAENMILRRERLPADKRSAFEYETIMFEPWMEPADLKDIESAKDNNTSDWRIIDSTKESLPDVLNRLGLQGYDLVSWEGMEIILMKRRPTHPQPQESPR